MNNEKREFREKCLKIRKTLPKKEASLSDFKDVSALKEAKVVFCYVSMGNEIGTKKLIEELLKKKTVVVPYCASKEGNMICVKISSLDELSEGMYGILEPKNPIKFDKMKIDVSILPALAFDEEGYRIGYGKGYYDRFLEDLNSFKVGLCYKELYFPKIPHEKSDVKADLVIKL